MPRRIRRVYADRATGDVTVTERIVPAGATVAERFAELRAGLPPACPSDPSEVAWAQVVCDGCGTAESVSFTAPDLPPGWTARDDGEFCPACTG